MVRMVWQMSRRTRARATTIAEDPAAVAMTRMLHRLDVLGVRGAARSTAQTRIGSAFSVSVLR
jgi:hypothetical protein